MARQKRGTVECQCCRFGEIGRCLTRNGEQGRLLASTPSRNALASSLVGLTYLRVEETSASLTDRGNILLVKDPEDQ
jgi:hypothetical protein